MPIEKSSQGELLAAHVAFQRVFGSSRSRAARTALVGMAEKGILDAMATVNELNRAKQVERNA
jgi:hypothetical protein